MTLPNFVDHSTVKLYKSNAKDLDVCRSAWVSQNTEAHEKEADPGRVEGLINFLWKNHHTSPFEHGQFTFIIETPIFVAREMMRHRTFSFNEVSGRYATLEPKFYVPGAHRPVVQTGKVGSYTFEQDAELMSKAIREIKSASANSWMMYQSMIEQGIAREVARMVLPTNIMTTFWATVNPRNLMHFLDLRTDPQALYEIREVADLMEAIFEAQMPLTYKAWANNKPKES